MEHQDWTPFDQTALGTVEIAPEVIEFIAGTAALDVEGVHALSGGFVGDIQEKLGRKNVRKGIRVRIGDQEVEVALSVIMVYGSSIPRVANELQHNVKQSIETMTSLTVKRVNVYVTGVAWDK